MTAKEQLTRLVRIQELATAIREAKGILAAAPGRIEEIEERFRERNAEYVAIKDRYDELELDRKTRSNELSVLEENKTKYTDDLMQVKNQKEYAAMLKEIDGVKAQISEHEEAILRDMEEIEKLTGELKTHEEHIAQERENFAREVAEVEAASAKAQEDIERLGGERGGQEEGLPRPLLASVRRLEEKRQGVFLAKADDGTCQSCFVMVRPQVFQEIKGASKVHACGNCRRYLYVASGLDLPAEAASGNSDDAAAPASGNDEPAEAAAAEASETPANPPAATDGGVEAVNGGAV